MQTGILFPKRTRMSNLDAFKEQSYLIPVQRKEIANERQFSPWSSDEFKTFGTVQPFTSIQFQNSVLRSMKRKHIENLESFPDQKGKSLQLQSTAHRSSYRNKISKDFFQLVKLQKRLTPHKEARRISDVSSVPINRIQMTLEMTSRELQKAHKEMTKINLKGREQPVKVKIAKKLKVKNQRQTLEDKYEEQGKSLLEELKIASNGRYSRLSSRTYRKSPPPRPFSQSIQFPIMEEQHQKTALGTISGPQTIVCKGGMIRNSLKCCRRYKFFSNEQTERAYFSKK